MVAERQVNVSRKLISMGSACGRDARVTWSWVRLGGPIAAVAGREHTKKRLCTPSASNGKLTGDFSPGALIFTLNRCRVVDVRGEVVAKSALRWQLIDCSPAWKSWLAVAMGRRYCRSLASEHYWPLTITAPQPRPRDCGRQTRRFRSL